jgi:hypothetical protein
MSVQYAVSSWSAAVLRRLPCRAIELLFACRDVCQCRRRIDFERPKFLVSNLFAERDQAAPTSVKQRGRFLGKVALSKFARALLLSFKANYLGTSPFVSVGTIESQLFKAS